MPIIATGTGTSYDSVAPVPTPEEAEVDVEITGPEEDDSVEITETPSDPPPTYGPTEFSDRFRFQIQSGMFDSSLRFDATKPRATGASVQAYEERQAVEFQVTQAAGSGSQSSALFALQFQDADPNGSGATSQVEGRVEYKRMAEQNLNLLATL